MIAQTQSLLPKVGSDLKVIAIGRVSTIHQDIENIEASYRFIEDYLRRIYTGPMSIRLLGEQASGMLTDRATIREAEALVATGTIDLVIAEDLARIYRNPRYQYDFVQNCVDMGTRVICIGDNLDTAEENWEITMGAAALRHGLHIPDTRRRVRRTATHSFHKGGMVLKIRYGYRKLTANEAATGEFGPKRLRIAKRAECTPTIQEISRRIIRGEKYTTIANWLNADGIEAGPYVKDRRWTARLIAPLLESRILCGMRTFRETICQPVFRTGRHKSSKNAEPETEYCPELAHLGREEHEVLCAEIARRRTAARSQKDRGQKRRGVQRRRSIWPGQAAVCASCGGIFYYAGSYLKCSNALPGRRPRCWNRVQVSAQLARERVVSWLVQHLNGTPLVRQAVVETVIALLQQTSSGTRRRQCELAREITTLERQRTNLATAIANGGQLQTLVERLRSIENALDLARTAQLGEQQPSDGSTVMPTKKQIEDSLSETMIMLAGSSFEFADLLRRIFPIFIIQPVQALDTPFVRPRAKLTFRPSNISSASTSQGADFADIEATIDLFEPPLHIRHLSKCLEARKEAPKLSLKRLAVRLGINYMTVKRSLDYARRLEWANANQPYCELHTPPDSASRWHLERAESNGRNSPTQFSPSATASWSPAN